MGLAYHAGVLAALEVAWGWDVRRTRLIIGTSAGACAGAMLRAGLTGRDLLDFVLGRPLRPIARDVTTRIRRPEAPQARPRGWYRPAEPRYLWHSARRPWAARPGRMVAAVLPRGAGCLEAYAGGFREVFGGGWPSDALWIPAVRLRDGKLAVFGHPTGPEVDVGTAVASSSAVPGVWKPVEIERDAYVDGGIASTAHVRLASDMPEISVAVLSSPLSRMPGVRSMLRSELRAVGREGLEVLRLEPGPGTVEAMGWNPMNRARALAVARVAYDETLVRLGKSSTGC